MKLLISLSFLLLMAGCASAPKNEEVLVSQPRANPYSNRPNVYQNKSAPQPSQVAPYETPESVIDYAGLQRFLKLDRGFNVLGYSERMFNTCEVGYGYSSTHECQKKYFIVSHFRLVCRDSEGTISQILTSADLTPLSRRQLNWNVKTASGSLYTDSDGYAQIAMISTQSQRMERLKIAIDNDFLYLKAGELKQMITPKNWCNR